MPTKYEGGAKMKGLLSIQEAAALSGQAISTIYRSVRNGDIKTHKIIHRGKDAYRIKLKDLEKYLDYKISNGNGSTSRTSHDTPVAPHNGKLHVKNVVNTEIDESQRSTSVNPEHKNTIKTDEDKLTREVIRDVIEEFFTTKQSQLMKPLEEQALYRLGILENEVKHLNGEKEALRREVDLYKSQLMALPGPAEEITAKLETLEQLEEENKTLKTSLALLPTPPEKVNEILINNREAIQKLQNQEKQNLILQQDKENQIQKMEDEIRREQEEKVKLEARLLQEKEEQTKKMESELQKILHDKEEALKEQETRRKIEAEELEARLKAEAEEQMKQVVDAWKKELEMAKRPWWKLW